MKLKVKDLRLLGEAVIQKSGFSLEDAKKILEVYLYGTFSGKRSHGIGNLISFPSKFPTVPKNPSIVEENNTTLLINGKGGVGQLVAEFALQYAYDKICKYGTCTVTIRNSHTYMIPGYLAYQIAKRNIIGIIANNSTPRVASPGETTPLIGTNPLAIGIPGNDYHFVLDMATSTRAMGEIRLAKQQGTKLDEGIALDSTGMPTRDPEAVYALTALGGYKGFGLGMAIDLLSGGLAGAKMGTGVDSSLDRGYTFVLIDPSKFQPLQNFKNNVTTYLSGMIKKGIRFPGYQAQKNYHAILESGEIEIDDKIYQQLQDLL